jgi:hypothetical protein
MGTGALRRHHRMAIAEAAIAAETTTTARATPQPSTNAASDATTGPDELDPSRCGSENRGLQQPLLYALRASNSGPRMQDRTPVGAFRATQGPTLRELGRVVRCRNISACGAVDFWPDV